MNQSRETSIDLITAHDDDPWNALAPHPDSHDQYHRSTAASLATTSEISSRGADFTSREPSIVTKPTSYGTDNPIYDDQNESKDDAIYAASLSASHGSRSEEEVERHDALGTTLSFMGAWSSSPQAQGQCLRKHEKAKPRLSKDLPNRLKKPPIVIHQSKLDVKSLLQGTNSASLNADTLTREGSKCLLYRVPPQHYTVLGLISLVILTIAICGYTIYYTDRACRACCTRSVFISVILVCSETVIAMLIAQRSLLEALLLGLFPLIAGFMFLLHIDGLVTFCPSG